MKYIFKTLYQFSGLYLFCKSVKDNLSATARRSCFCCRICLYWIVYYEPTCLLFCCYQIGLSTQEWWTSLPKLFTHNRKLWKLENRDSVQTRVCGINRIFVAFYALIIEITIVAMIIIMSTEIVTNMTIIVIQMEVIRWL